MPRIPPPQAIGDGFTGLLLRHGETDFIAHAPLAGAEVVGSGSYTLRYGLRILGKHWLSIVPGLVAVDYGTFLTGEDAWDFLTRRSNLYPRAEVFGVRENGVDDQLFVRQLDIALPPQVLLYADAGDKVPLAMPAAFLGMGAESLSERLRAYLPVFETLDAWIQSVRPHDESQGDT